MRKLFLFLLFFVSSLPLWATHQRAAEITYEWKGGNTYEFTLTCYTYTPSPAGFQRDSLLMFWGDGFADNVPRVVLQDLGDDYTLNIYRMTHSYASSGTYVISMEDPDRNYGVVNVPNSVNVPMYIETELVISPFLGYNNSVQLLNAPVDKGCVGKPYYHNPAAYDPDGDSLSYRLIPCRGTNGEEIPGYTFPQASSSIDIDPVTGELQWENPVLQGEYNIAILIEEWRNGIKIGSVTRDMQVLINACNNNNPEISCLTDVCVIAGDTLDMVIHGSDPDGDQVTLTASGGPFEVAESPAVLTPPSASGLQPALSLTWNTLCNHIRRTPYQVVVHAKDDAFPIALTNVRNINISVIGPPVEGLVADFEGAGVALSWSPYSCPNAEKLRLYRKMGSTPYTPESCETGVRPGYQLVAELDPQSTTFIDNNNNMGFAQGVEYCYRLVAVFHDDYESVPSEEICVRQQNDLPLMTQVSNDSLDLGPGHVRVRWAQPREIMPQYQAPFAYKLLRYLDGNETVLYNGTDSLFFDEQVNMTEVQQLRYRVEMRDASQQLIGVSTAAEPVMLIGIGGDGKATLQWTENVPWTVDSTEIYKENDRGFVKIGSSVTMSYTDAQLENGLEYRYYVRTYGHYALTGLPRPIVNWSAIVAVTPNDDEPPAPLQLMVEPDCDEEENVLSWNRPLEEDVAGYRVYYCAVTADGFALLETLNNTFDTLYRHQDLLSTVGCYYMTAFDEKGNVSLPSDTVCVNMDDCPIYELPNVFTPNGDGINDIFVPIHVSKVAVDHVEMHIFNRWGLHVFETEDPYINWDGRASGTHQECADGTYFYVCDVYTKSPEGLVSQRLQGTILVLR